MGFIVNVEVRECSEPGKGRGVFLLEDVACGSIVWVPTELSSWSTDEAAVHLREMPAARAQEFLRHCFVAPTAPDRLQLNPDDNGRFTNHASPANTAACTDPSAGSAALRDLRAGDELTVDYAIFASPPWYLQLCEEFGVLPTDEVARRFA